MKIRVLTFSIFISSFLFVSIDNSFNNTDIYNNLHLSFPFNVKTYELKYDDGFCDIGFTDPRAYISEPFENGFGFYFDLDDFDVFNNINIFKIIEASVYISSPEPQIKSDEESRQVLCGGIGDRRGPKGPYDVLFAIPDDGIIAYDYEFEGWITFTEKDGSWGKDDGAKYDYNGLPYICKKEQLKNEHGYWLWVALTQVKSDGYIYDYDLGNYIGCDRHVSHHCYRGEGYYEWYEYSFRSTCLIHLIIEIISGPFIENSSIGLIKSIFQ
ncbi:MAG: hypothetical protein ACUVWP_07030 [bacterium]